jgi:hypothetical protein
MPIWDIVDFLSEKRDYGDVISILSSMSEEKKEQGNINYSISINSTISAIKDFTGKENLPIQVVTPAWLKDFETKLLTKGGSKGNRKTRTKMSVNGASAVFDLRNKTLVATEIFSGLYLGKIVLPPKLLKINNIFQCNKNLTKYM